MTNENHWGARVGRLAALLAFAFVIYAPLESWADGPKAPDRHVNDYFVKLFRSHIPKGAKVEVVSVRDDEAQTFANEVCAFLRNEGDEVHGPTEWQGDGTVWGQGISPSGDGFKFIIGKQPGH